MALVAFATTAWAQTNSSTSNPVALTIVPFLSCTADRGIDYGTHRRVDNGGLLFTDATNYAQWTCQTDPGNRASFTFVLPTVMTNGGNPTIPLTFGSSSAFVSANGVRFDPHSGLGNDFVSSGTATITLGQPSQAPSFNDLVQVDIRNSVTGPYTAVVVLNVTLN
jgi:hypothetical protein